MVKDKSLHELINLKRLKLIREVFEINESRDFRTGDEIEVYNALQIEVSIGSDGDDNTIIAYKVKTIIMQSTEKIKNFDDDANYISKLEFDYIAFFNLDPSYVDEFWNILEKREQERKSEAEAIANYMINSIYPYLKEHIENVYKKALISIEIPLKIQ